MEMYNNGNWCEWPEVEDALVKQEAMIGDRDRELLYSKKREDKLVEVIKVKSTNNMKLEKYQDRLIVACVSLTLVLIAAIVKIIELS